MWIDDRGVFHTVAVPDPTELMSDEFRATLDALVEVDPSGVLGLIEAQQESFLGGGTSGPVDPETEARFHAASPPRSLLVAPVVTLDDLATVVAGVDRRWRFDLLMALEDYVA